MFAAQRLEVIKDLLIKNKSIEVSGLATILNVSDVTVRKDLDKLESDGFLLKTHGGAILADADTSQPSNLMIEHYVEKKKIATLASTLIDAGDSIFIGQGSTCYMLSAYIKNKTQLSIATNNVALATQVGGSVKGIHLLGGKINYLSGLPYTSGVHVSGYLEGINVSKAFISVNGVDIMAGLTCDDLDEANSLRNVIKIAKQVIVLADHTKFNRIGMYNIAPLSSVSAIVTDECEYSEYRLAAFNKNIKFLTVFEI